MAINPATLNKIKKPIKALGKAILLSSALGMAGAMYRNPDASLPLGAVKGMFGAIPGAAASLALSPSGKLLYPGIAAGSFGTSYGLSGPGSWLSDQTTGLLIGSYLDEIFHPRKSDENISKMHREINQKLSRLENLQKESALYKAASKMGYFGLAKKILSNPTLQTIAGEGIAAGTVAGGVSLIRDQGFWNGFMTGAKVGSGGAILSTLLNSKSLSGEGSPIDSAYAKATSKVKPSNNPEVLKAQKKLEETAKSMDGFFNSMAQKPPSATRAMTLGLISGLIATKSTDGSEARRINLNLDKYSSLKETLQKQASFRFPWFKLMALGTAGAIGAGLFNRWKRKHDWESMAPFQQQAVGAEQARRSPGFGRTSHIGWGGQSYQYRGA